MDFVFAVMLAGLIKAWRFNADCALQPTYRRWSVLLTFCIRGGAYFVFMMLAAQHLGPPPKEHAPKDFNSANLMTSRNFR